MSEKIRTLIIVSLCKFEKCDRRGTEFIALANDGYVNYCQSHYDLVMSVD